MYYLPAFNIEGTTVEKIVLKDMATKYYSSVLVGEKRKLEIVFKLFHYRLWPDRLQQCPQLTALGDSELHKVTLLWIRAVCRVRVS